MCVGGRLAQTTTHAGTNAMLKHGTAQACKAAPTSMLTLSADIAANESATHTALTICPTVRRQSSVGIGVAALRLAAGQESLTHCGRWQEAVLPQTAP